MSLKKSKNSESLGMESSSKGIFCTAKSLNKNSAKQSVTNPAIQQSIGGQDCVTLSKAGRPFWGPKGYLAGSCQSSAGNEKHIALKAGVEGF